MAWYSKYLTAFEKPWEEVPGALIEEVKEKLKKFQSDSPLASVVVIAHNEERRILSCLWSLSENICDFPIEIICINNNSADKTSEVLDALRVKWYFEEKKGPGHARTCGLLHARGKYYFSIDADTIYPGSYFQTMIQTLHKKGVVAVSSIYSFIPGPTISKSKLKIYELLRDIHFKALSFRSPELVARGAVFAYIAEYGKKIGYRTNIRAGEDGAMALGLKKYGKVKFILCHKARVITSANPLEEEESLWKNFTKRFRKGAKYFKRYLFRQETYEDTDSNLLLSSQEHA